MNTEELKQLMREAGIVGAGGAGFPSYAKLAPGADTLLINGSECEPLLYTDYMLLKKELPAVVEGAAAVLEALSVPRALLCIKQRTAGRLRLKDGEKLAPSVTVKLLPDVYPMGDELNLIYETTGRTVKPGGLPISAGVIVYNAETVYNIAMAVKKQRKVTRKWLTIGGDIPEAIVVEVPVGTPVSDLFAKYSVTIPEGSVVIDGGPSMGKIIDPERAVVTKTTKGLLILPETAEAVQSKLLDPASSVTRAETACCQCTRCTDLCPRALLGYPIEPHKLVRTAKGAKKLLPELILSATLCCGCGICSSIACCQGISPKAVIDGCKTALAERKLRFRSDSAPRVSPEREYRMLPEERWEQALGVAKFDKIPVFRGDDADFARVEIPLGPGVPGKPAVQDGAHVERGDKIAESAEGLSVPQHASIGGTVTLAAGKIIIERTRSEKE